MGEIPLPEPSEVSRIDMLEAPYLCALDCAVAATEPTTYHRYIIQRYSYSYAPNLVYPISRGRFHVNRSPRRTELSYLFKINVDYFSRNGSSLKIL